MPAGGTPNGLDVCDKPGGVQVTSANDISNFNRGSDYVNAKQDDAQIATKAGNQRQAEATALGVSLGDVEVQIGTAVTDTTSGDSTDKSKVPLTFFTFASQDRRLSSAIKARSACRRQPTRPRPSCRSALPR